MTTTAEQADIDFWQSQAAFLGSDDEVGRRGNRQTRAECRAVNGDDDRLGAFANRMKTFSCTTRVRG